MINIVQSSSPYLADQNLEAEGARILSSFSARYRDLHSSEQPRNHYMP